MILIKEYNCVPALAGEHTIIIYKNTRVKVTFFFNYLLVGEVREIRVYENRDSGIGKG
jgi:hypothetical protein